MSISFKRAVISLLVAGTAIVTSDAFALPIDWNGVFGVDYNLIDSYRRTSGTDNNFTGTGNEGSQEVTHVEGSHGNLKFQSYLFRLNPTILVNDSASIKGELTHGYGRTGYLGEGLVSSQEDVDGVTSPRGSMANALYMHNTTDSSQNNIGLTKLYMELYSDTATYVIGRHTSHWGLGAVVNSGEKVWDRHTYIRDGITAKMKLGYFNIEPYYGKVGSSSIAAGTEVLDYGFSILYDNPERDMGFGILYSVRTGDTGADIDVDGDGTTNKLNDSDVKMYDIYFKKGFGKFSFEVEVPLMNGEIGTIYDNQGPSKFGAKGFIAEAKYKYDSNFTFGLLAGQASGHDGDKSKYGALYLNPNYQVANILFRYNMHAVDGGSVYDSAIANARYAKLYAEWAKDKWQWNAAIIYASALETASAGEEAYNHEKNKQFTANADQESDLGTEIDLNFNYRWNNEVTLGGSAAYLMTGDYYAFTNDATTKNSTEDVMAFQVRASIEF